MTANANGDAHKNAALYDKKQAADFYEERYTKGYMDEWPAFKKQRVFALIRSLGLPARGRALDIGCGNGVFTDVIKQALPEWEVYGAEISETAVLHARERYPNCNFLVATDEQLKQMKFDFIYSHHVLEHVYNIREFLAEIHEKLNPNAHMFHICPCGNEGSLEDQISRMMKDGIDTTRENRRFFEEPGHLRRLTSDDVAQIVKDFGFSLQHEWYANHYWEAIHWVTEWQRDEVLKLTNYNQAINDEARQKLKKMRRALLTLALLRLPLITHGILRQRKQKGVKDIVKLAGATTLLPLAKMAETVIYNKGQAEWEQMKTDRSGGEMYLHFSRNIA